MIIFKSASELTPVAIQLIDLRVIKVDKDVRSTFTCNTRLHNNFPLHDSVDNIELVPLSNERSVFVSYKNKFTAGFELMAKHEIFNTWLVMAALVKLMAWFSSIITPSTTILNNGYAKQTNVYFIQQIFFRLIIIIIITFHVDKKRLQRQERIAHTVQVTTRVILFVGD